VSRKLTLPVIISGYTAVSWLLVLTALNMITQGSFRTTLLFAVPVCAVAWYHWQAGFVFAALAILCAWMGGAMPEPGSTEPLWVDALVAFAKLSIDAVVAFTWGRRVRAKARGRASQRGVDSID
jgi:hypothetical protein